MQELAAAQPNLNNTAGPLKRTPGSPRSPYEPSSVSGNGEEWSTRFADKAAQVVFDEERGLYSPGNSGTKIR